MTDKPMATDAPLPADLQARVEGVMSVVRPYGFADDSSIARAVESLARELAAERAALTLFSRYTDYMNPGLVEFCGRCGAPCENVRPGKFQCHVCDWLDYAPDSPLVAECARADALADALRLIEQTTVSQVSGNIARDALTRHARGAP